MTGNILRYYLKRSFIEKKSQTWKDSINLLKIANIFIYFEIYNTGKLTVTFTFYNF